MIVDGWQCGECEHLFTDPGGPVYECGTCGQPTVDERQCSLCHKFMAKVADESCPDCESFGCLNLEHLFQAPDGSLHLTEEDYITMQREAPARAAKAAEAQRQTDEFLAEYNRQRAAERAERRRKTVLVKEVLAKLAPNLCEHYDIDKIGTSQEWMVASYFDTTTLTIDPDELLALALVALEPVASLQRQKT